MYNQFSAIGRKTQIITTEAQAPQQLTTPCGLTVEILSGGTTHRHPEVAAARRLAMLPSRLGGFGLQCAARTALAACWAAWADALPVLHARRRDAAARCLAELTQGPASAAACLRAAEEAGRLLDRTNWTGRPSWSDLLNNLRPAQCDLPELGKRCQGWQHHGSRACSSHFRETELLPAPASPLLRSQSGPHAAAWLSRPTACS